MKSKNTRLFLNLSSALFCAAALFSACHTGSNDSTPRPDGVPEDAILGANELYYDPVEDTEEYKKVIEDVKKEVFHAFALEQMEIAKSGGLVEDEDSLKYKEAERLINAGKFVEAGEQYANGANLDIWVEEQKLLKEKYNINWRTPAEMNPHVQFN